MCTCATSLILDDWGPGLHTVWNVAIRLFAKPSSKKACWEYCMLLMPLLPPLGSLLGGGGVFSDFKSNDLSLLSLRANSMRLLMHAPLQQV